LTTYNHVSKVIIPKTFALQILFCLIIHILEKRRHQFYQLSTLKVKREKQKKRKREEESPCLKNTAKTISASNKLTFGMLISFLESKACYQRYLDDCSNARQSSFPTKIPK
jgi:hypothetical protein